MTVDLSIIIVNWNSADYLKKCLRRIFKGTEELNFEVIVVDNASYDGCEEMLKAEFPPVKFVQCRENLGFAAANNVGFQHSSGRNLLFLNPDTEVIGPAIQVMSSRLTTLENAGAVGCKLLNSDGSVQTTCIQRFPTLVNQMLSANYLISRFPQLKIWGIKPLFSDNGTPQPVEVVSGACLMTQRAVFERIGGFTTTYFMYADDVDLCYKTRQIGLMAYYVGEVSVTHHGSGSTSKSTINNFNEVVKRESIARFLKATKGRHVAAAYRMSTASVSVLRLGALLFLMSIHKVFFRDWALHPKYTKWVKILRWSLGFEKWARNLGSSHISA